MDSTKTAITGNEPASEMTLLQAIAANQLLAYRSNDFIGRNYNNDKLAEWSLKDAEALIRALNGSPKPDHEDLSNLTGLNIMLQEKSKTLADVVLKALAQNALSPDDMHAAAKAVLTAVTVCETAIKNDFQ